MSPVQPLAVVQVFYMRILQIRVSSLHYLNLNIEIRPRPIIAWMSMVYKPKLQAYMLNIT